MRSDNFLRTSASVAHLRAVEDANPDLLSVALEGDDLPLWPRVRMFFASALTAKELGSTGVPTSSSRLRNYARLARACMPSSRDARALKGKSDVVMIASGVTTSVTDGVEHNWLFEDYAEALSDRGALLQWTPHGSARPAYARTRSLDEANARVDLRAVLKGFSASRRREITELITTYADLFDGAIPPASAASISASVQYQERRAPLLRAEIMRILARLSPHTVLLEDASYGHRGDLIAAMKATGIHVVEPQHGWIGPSHAAYNVGSVMYQSNMRAQLPDELLTFGTFWSNGIHIPAHKTALGKPYLESSAQKAPPFTKRPRTVLIASSISAPEETERFILSLRDRLPNWTLRFRPHPSERATLLDRYPKLATAHGIEIDPYSDLYNSLSECRAVIGIASTVLFEAAEFECDVIVRRSPFSDFYVGDIFGPTYEDSEVSEIAERLNDNVVRSKATEFWQVNSQRLVKEWAKSQLR